MGNANRLVTVIAGGAILFGAVCVFGQDWTQWRGVNRDGKASGFIAPAAWPKELSQKWKTTVGLGDATPALVGDRLYVFTRQGDDEIAMCLNAADGKEVWHYKYAAIAVTGPPSAHPGPRSSPAVADGKVITLGVGCVLSCLDAASGNVIWSNKDYATTESPFFTATSPIVVDGMCIAQLGKKDTGVVAAFDLKTGDVKWKWGPGDCPSFSSPALMTVDGVKQIVALTEQRYVGISTADGKLLWEIPFESKGRAFNAPSPIIDGQTLIYTGATRGTKAVKIEKQDDGFAVKELWSSPIATTFNTPVLKDGLLYGLSELRQLVLPERQNRRGCLDCQRQTYRVRFDRRCRPGTHGPDRKSRIDRLQTERQGIRGSGAVQGFRDADLRLSGNRGKADFCEGQRCRDAVDDGII